MALLDWVMDPLAGFNFPPEVQERADHLADRATEGLLSDEERAEYEALIEAADFIAILKLKALNRLDRDRGQTPHT